MPWRCPFSLPCLANSEMQQTGRSTSQRNSTLQSRNSTQPSLQSWTYVFPRRTRLSMILLTMKGEFSYRRVMGKKTADCRDYPLIKHVIPDAVMLGLIFIHHHDRQRSILSVKVNFHPSHTLPCKRTEPGILKT